MGLFTTSNRLVLILLLLFTPSIIHAAAIKGLEEGSAVGFCKQIDFVGGSQTLSNSGLNCTVTSTGLSTTGGTMTGNLTINGSLTSTTVSVTGDGTQSTITEGLVINSGKGGDLDDDFTWHGVTVDNLIFGDASTNRVGFGTAIPAEQFHVVSPGARFTRFSSGGNPFDFTMQNSRGAEGSPSALQAGDSFADFTFRPDDGTDMLSIAASFGAIMSQTATSNNVDAHLVFRTTSNGTTPTERMRIEDGGNVGIGETNPDTPLHITKSEAAVSTDILKLENPSSTSGVGANIKWYLAGQTNAATSIEGVRNGGGLDVELKFGTTTDITTSAATTKMTIQGNGVITHSTLVTAPSTCSIGEFYVDTSGAYCACTALNTWSNMTATGSCI